VCRVSETSFSLNSFCIRSTPTVAELVEVRSLSEVEMLQIGANGQTNNLPLHGGASRKMFSFLFIQKSMNSLCSSDN
jgi:hypothetical protein